MSRCRREWGLAWLLALCGAFTLEGAPMTVDDCVAYALAHSRELRRLDIDLRDSQFTTLVRRGKFATDVAAEVLQEDPSGDVSGSLTLAKDFPGSLSASAGVNVTDAGAGAEDTGSVSVSLSKVILGGGSILESRLDIDSSLLDELIQKNRIARYRRELGYGVRRAFYGIIRDRQTVRVWELKLERARQNLELALEREDPLDIANARLEIPETQAAKLRAEQAVKTAVDDLKRLVGMPVSADIDIDPNFTFRTEAIDPAGDTAFCFANHEDLLNAALSKQKREWESRVEKPRSLPRITLSASGKQGSEEGIDFGADPEYEVGLSAAWEVGARSQRAAYRRAVNRVDREDLDIESLREDKVQRIRELARKLAETEQLVDLQQGRIEVGELRVALYKDRWENGELGILEYVRSQNDLENSRIQLINLKTAYMEVLAEYHFVVGR